MCILLLPESDDLDGKQRACDSLVMCILTTLNQGLRNGGGIGDVLRKPSSLVYTQLSTSSSLLLLNNT